MLELQHAGDVVPRLDMGDSLYTPNPSFPAVPVQPGVPGGYDQAGPQHTTVTLPNPGSALDVAGNHSHSNYSASIAGSQDPGLLAYEQQLREAGFLSGNASNTSAVDIQVGRQN